MEKNNKLLKPDALLNILEDLEEEKHNLNERHKELNALYELDKLKEREETISSLLKKAVLLIPPAWQYPKITGARISLNGKRYFTKNFKETKLIQTANIIINKKNAGLIEVIYLKKTKDESEGPFLKEERNLINSFATQLGVFVEKKKAEKNLKESEENLRLNIEKMPIAYIVWDIEWKVMEWNHAAETIFGYTKKEVLGKNVINSIVPKPARSLVVSLMDDLKKGKSVHYSEKDNNLRKDGTLISCKWSNIPLLDKNKKVFAILSMAEDITERKKAEEEVKRLNIQLKKKFKESEEKFKTIYESSTDAIMILEPPKWNFTAGNPATIKMFKANGEEEFITLRPWDISPEKQPDGQFSSKKAKKMIEIAIKEGSNLFDWTHKRISGDNFPATVLLTRMKLDGKNVLQATVRDITQEKTAERKLKVAYEELKTLDEVKSNFLLITSHELKTPITPIMIQSEMFLKGDLGPLNPKQKEAATMITRNMKRLTKLINDILDVSKISSNVMKIQTKTNDINSTILEIFKEKKIEAEKKNIKITFKKADLPKIKFDDFRISQVILNLVDNAIKFTPEGGRVRIETKRKENKILISVKDNGKGILKKDFAKIFKPFFQAKPSYMEKHRGGTGLGLAIARGIINNHGGHIWAASKPKNGAHFYFTLPIKAQPKKTENLKILKAKKEVVKN